MGDKLTIHQLEDLMADDRAPRLLPDGTTEERPLLADVLAAGKSELADLRTKVTKLETELATMREALAWYRDAQYDPRLSDDIHDDKG